MRSCGGCRECCTHLGITQTDSPPGETCKHVCAKGCGIYESRPTPCRTFKCLWLMGAFSVNDRPDKTKMCCWVTHSDLMTRKDKKQPVVYASHRPNVKPHKKTLKRLIASSYVDPVVVIPGRGHDPKTRTIYWQGKKVE